MSFKKQSYENTAKSVIKKFEQRGMEGYYCADKEEARKLVLELMEEGSSVTWGGSMSLEEAGIIEAVKNGPYEAIDRKTAKTPEESRALYGKMVCADYCLMSTNAFTVDGQLVNIDGHGNRVACLITGPKYVIVVAGMNKLVKTVEDGIDRIKTIACPPNTVRLGIPTPCNNTGVCGDCYGKASICCQTVITRNSKDIGRIKIVLVGEELGY